MELARDNFRYLATESKKRMKHGYWTKVINNRNTDINEARIKGQGVDNIYSYYRNKVMSDFYRECLPVTDEEVLYSKVCSILDSDDNVTNILGVLMDKDYYAKLESEEQARYILKLSRMYIKMKERYHLEKIAIT